jgi:hypothetical protein
MSRDIFRQFINIFTLVFTLVMNALANILPLNGQQTGEISDTFDVFFVPAGYVFSIWGLIYLGLIAFTVYQALPSQRENPRLRRIGYLFALSNIANGVWVIFWHYNMYPLSLLQMLILLVCLIMIYLTLEIGRAKVSTIEKWVVFVPFSVYLGWITVATIANVTSVLWYLNWGGFGIAPEMWAAIMLVVATVVAALMALSRGDVPYLLVLIWAFIGIAVKHADTPIVANTAWLTTGIVIVLAVLGWQRKRQGRLISFGL